MNLARTEASVLDIDSRAVLLTIGLISGPMIAGRFRLSVSDSISRSASVSSSGFFRSSTVCQSMSKAPSCMVPADSLS